jgi:NADPH2:quinone reductase
VKAVLCKAFGPPESLVLEEVDDPIPGEGQVLVSVRAAAVTFPDTLILENQYQLKASLPYIPGSEIAGLVSALGPGVSGLAIGDRVVGSGVIAGAFAELAAIPAESARRLPDDAGFAESAGLMDSYGTGYYGLRYRGNLQPGETLLVLGAGGGVGLAAVELGVLMGARVIAAASSEEKLAMCKERGADEVIDYSREDLKQRAKELTDGKGVQVVYDAVGGDYAEAALRAVAWNGRFLVIGFTAGIPRIPLNLALLKGCQIVGVFLGGMAGREPEIYAAVQQRLLEFMASGKLKPRISRRYSLDEAPQALRDMMDRKVIGRVVVEP